MWISQTAKEAGVNAQTLRCYERRSLLPKPPRRGSGYRGYPGDAVRIVRFIKRHRVRAIADPATTAARPSVRSSTR